MSTFITSTDYDASIRSEILDAITRSDAAIVEIAEDRAIEEIKGYLSGRYQVEEIFAKTGGNRHPLILMFAIDITIYHLHSAANSVKIPENRTNRYNRAISWLDRVAKGYISPSDLPVLAPAETRGNILRGGNEKRNNHF